MDALSGATVWCVFHNDAVGESLEQVFSTEDLAREWMAKQTHKNDWDAVDYVIDEPLRRTPAPQYCPKCHGAVSVFGDGRWRCDVPGCVDTGVLRVGEGFEKKHGST